MILIRCIHAQNTYQKYFKIHSKEKHQKLSKEHFLINLFVELISYAKNKFDWFYDKKENQHFKNVKQEHYRHRSQIMERTMSRVSDCLSLIRYQWVFRILCLELEAWLSCKNSPLCFFNDFLFYCHPFKPVLIPLVIAQDIKVYDRN